MNKTGIEWVRNPDGSQGYTWNPITGCLNHDNGLCKGGGFPCYAYKLANGRLKQRYLGNANVADISNRLRDPNSSLWDKVATDPFYPRFWEERLTPLHIPRKADSPKKGIFVCDMGELFGDWIPQSWQEQVFNAIKANPDYRFYLLTKQPQRLSAFSPFPENCWVGVTATNADFGRSASMHIQDIKALIKFISIEPLLGQGKDFNWQDIYLGAFDWLIIGACTGTGIEMLRLAEAYKREDGSVMPYGNKFTLQPKIEWVQEIVKAADKAGIPVFLKDNIVPAIAGKGTPDGLFYKDIWLRQEIPK